jgi:hypothetical protein
VDPGEDAGETVKKTPGKDQTVPVNPPPPPPPPPEVREPVTCVFSGSTEPQKCYSGSGNFGCEGVTSCTVQVTAAPGTQLTWNSSCGGYAYTTVDGVAEKAVFACPPKESKELVTCLFIGSNAPQKCYSASSGGNFGCSGVASCDVTVVGKSGDKITWNSSCGGYAYTVIDGVAEKAAFYCSPKSDVEMVTCLFKGSSAVQECYSATSGSTGYGCKGVTSCTIKVQAKPGTKITWKSSCGGYAYTTVDGVDENAEFFCAP